MMPPKTATTRERDLEHWRSLCLLPGAAECVIKAAHRYFIEIHHPDRGGDLEAAQRVNVAYDELRGQGASANSYVAENFSGEPWHVLGVQANADHVLVERAGRALTGELGQHPRLREKVNWAMTHVGEPARGIAPRRAPPPPPRRPQQRAEQPPKPRPAAGKPEGLLQAIDLGTLEWGSTITRDMRLTWSSYAPYNINTDAPAPLVATVTASKALPGRFVVSFSVDWSSGEFSDNPRIRGYNMDVTAHVRWPGGEAPVRVRATLLYPPVVTPSPLELDLGTVEANARVRASLMLISTAPALVEMRPSAWLRRVDGDGTPLDGALRLATNTAVRVVFEVLWEPILERAKDVARGKPVRPTGRVTVRWEHGEVDIPLQMVVRR